MVSIVTHDPEKQSIPENPRTPLQEENWNGKLDSSTDQLSDNHTTTWSEYCEKEQAKQNQPRTPLQEGDCDFAKKTKLVWKSLEQVFQLLNNPELPVLDKIPPGIKNDVSFNIKHKFSEIHSSPLYTLE